VLTTCPVCGAEQFQKQVTAAGFQLKGSGWYVTDFRNGAGNAAAGPAAPATAAPATGGDAAPAASPATAPAAAPAPSSDSGGGSSSASHGGACGSGCTH